jgi:signal transduction histidine kinase
MMKAASEMHAQTRSTRELSLLAMLGLLFLGLALISAFLIAGESRRARILVEYEADRIAAGLLDDFRSQGEVDQVILDPRVLAFGIYRPDGSLAAGFGNAPGRISLAGPAFVYDEGRQSLSLERPIGMMPGADQAPRLGMMQGPRGMDRRGRDPTGLFYLSMGIGAYYRSSALYKVAIVLVPIIIAALAAAFLALLSSNFRFRRAAMERETLARLGESARTLAHEIRNPLGAIRIQTGLLRRKLSGSGDRELDAIEEETERLNALTRRVGDFLRNPLGEPEPVELGSFLRDLAGRMPCPIRMEAELPEATVLFDPELLRSVIENLARNAHESYSSSCGEGLVELSLALESSREGRRAALSVLDRGPGIPPDLMGKVFDPFFTSKSQGSGIGLPLARSFVEAAGGTLALLPRQGGGTEARISLPTQEGTAPEGRAR